MKLHFRPAVEIDLPQILEMLADDQLGSAREDASVPVNLNYINAFKAIDSDPNNELVVVEIVERDSDIDIATNKAIAGILQLTFIPYLTYKGSWRCLVEGVRVHKVYRGKGLGTQFFEWAINRAKDKGCQMIQLTSNKQRRDAIRFYENLGFKDSHEGFKLELK